MQRRISGPFKVILERFSEQPRERLEMGMLTATNGHWGDTWGTWFDLEGRIIKLANPFAQYKLTQGMVKIRLTEADRRKYANQLEEMGLEGSYVPMDNLPELIKEHCSLCSAPMRRAYRKQSWAQRFGIPITSSYDYGL